MIKTFRRQLVSILLVLLMVVTLFVPSFAAEEDLGSCTLTFDSGDPSAPYSVTFAAVNTSSGQGFITSSGEEGSYTVEFGAAGYESCGSLYNTVTTVTVTKTPGTIFSFYYTMVKGKENDSNFEVRNDEGDLIKPNGNRYVIGEDTTTFTLTSLTALNEMSEVHLYSLSLRESGTAEVTFLPPTVGGSYTVDGTGVTESTTITTNDATAHPIVATASSGYVFAGIAEVFEDVDEYDNPITVYSIISAQKNVDYYADYDMTVTALFVPTSSASFLVGSVEYGYTLCSSFADAVDTATNNAAEYIIPITDSTVPSGEYEIPYGCTLLIPFNDAFTCFRELATSKSGTATITENAYRKLTLASGVTLNVADGAAISVSAVPCATHTSAANNGPVIGKYGQLIVSEGATLNCNGDSQLFAWGFVTGGGQVNMNDTSRVYEFYQVQDWRGGTITTSTAMENGNQFPFNQYYVQNVETRMTIQSTAKNIVMMSIYAAGGITTCDAEFIGSNGMFVLKSGSTLTRYYDYTNDKMEYIINGDAEISSITMDIGGIATVNSDDYYLPINNTEVTVERGTLSAGKDIIFLPGSGVTVNSGAAIEITDGGSVVFADTDIGKYGAIGGTSLPPCTRTKFSPSRTPVAQECTAAILNARWADTEGASINNNGTVIVDEGATIASTSGGANLYSSTGNGVYEINGSMDCPVMTVYDGSVEGNSTTFETQDVVLQNDMTGDAEGSVAYTSERWSDDASGRFVMKEIAGVKTWGDYRDVTFYDRNGTQVGEVAVKMGAAEKADVEPTYTALIEASYTDETGHENIFDHWDYTVVDNGHVTAAPFYRKQVSVTWHDTTGTWTEDVVEYYLTGAMPVAPTANIPVKANTELYSYTYTWSPAIVAAGLEDVTYNGSFTPVALYNEPTWSWTADDSDAAATATLTPKGEGENIVKSGDDVTITSERTSAVTCTTDGDITYTAKITLVDSDQGTVEYTNSKRVTTTKLGHDWSGGTTTVWADDYASASMAVVCAHDNTHIQSYDAVPAMNVYDASTGKLTKTVTFPGGTKVSHTPNISDEGVRDGDAPDDAHLLDTVNIAGATSLHVVLTYGTEEGWDYVFVIPGEYTGTVSSSDISGQLYKLTGNANTPATIEFDYEGDTLTFGFYSDDYDYSAYYGYYAVITASDVVLTHDFDDVVDMTFSEHAGIPVTCETDGTLTYYTDTDGRYYLKEGDVYTEVTYEDTQVPVAALGHDWDPTYHYKWADDNSTCTRYLVCTHDPSHELDLVSEQAERYQYDASTHTLYNVAKFGETFYSHTDNVDDDGNQLYNYGNNWITNDVVTAPGASQLHVYLVFGGESANYDYVCVWDGAHSDYRANNSTHKLTAHVENSPSPQNFPGQYGGGSHTSASNVREFDIEGDSVTFSFYSDSGSCGDGYGYYAVITTDKFSPQMKNLGTVDLSLSRRNGHKATCVAEGNYPYFVGSDGLIYLQDSENENIYHEVDLADTVIPMSGHEWDEEPTYAWAEDYTTASKLVVCKNDPSHIDEDSSETVDTTVETVNGIHTYTAKFKGSVTRISHTSNITDDGTQTTTYPNNASVKDVVTISGADKLHVVITYGTESTSFDGVLVFKGDPGTVNQSTSGSMKKLGGNNSNLATEEFDISGDTVTFYFYSDTSVAHYGYYAVVTAVVPESDVQTMTVYNIGWDTDGDGTVDDTQTVEHGTVLSHAMPVKTDTTGLEEDETWVFSGWDYAYTAKLDGTTPSGTIETYMDGTRKDNGSSVLAEADGNIVFTAKFAKSGKLFKSHSISVKEDIGTNFYMDLSSLIQDPSSGFEVRGAYVQFSWGSDPANDGAPFTERVYIQKVDSVPVTAGRRAVPSKLDLATTGAGEEYLYKASANVAAKEMNDSITAILYDGEGDMIGSDTYKACDYLYTIINNRAKAEEVCDGDTDKADELQALCRSTLIYGAKAQLQFRYNTDNLVDEDLADNSFTMMSTSDFAAYSILTSPYSDLAQCFPTLGFDYYGTALSLNAEVEYNLFFRLNEHVPMTVTASDGYTVTRTVVNSNDGQDEGYDDGDFVRYDILGVPAAKLRNNITLTFAPEGDEAITLTVNPQTYMYAAMWLVETYGTGYDDTRYLADVISTLYDYSVKAEAYFG